MPADVRPADVVVGKTVNYRQAADGSLARLNYHFYAEISLPRALEGGTARLIDPRGRVIPFKLRTGGLGIPGDRDFATLTEMNASVPNGDYRVEIDAPPASAIRGVLPLHATEDALADPVQLTLLQDGRPVAPGAVKVGKPLTVAWSSFRKGRSDPNDIIDDLIFVHIGDCRGQILARTPGAFGGKPPLTYRETSYVVPANSLEPGATYQISVEHAPLQTRRLAGVPALAAYPASTYLDFRTEGAGSNACPDKPYRMDNGQSDRQRAPVVAGNSVTDQVTFLYYDDLTEPRKFYRETLGLTAYFESESSSLFHTTRDATIGLVKVARADVTPAVKRSVVMVSIVTDDVAGWYNKLKQDPKVHLAKTLYDHPRVPIRAFEVEDPGGYCIEFFQWLAERH